MTRIRRYASAAALLILTACLAAPPVRAADPATPLWQPVEGSWQGGSTAPVWMLQAWPGKDLVFASTRANGLWGSTDNGTTWQRMGEPGKTPPNAGQAVDFVFDPDHPDSMWTSGMYGYGVWHTTDGGKTFAQVSKNTHVDGYAVDFTDPQRQLQLMGLHEQEHSLHRSLDGGATWTKIGEKIPDGTAFTTNPIILDRKTWLINSSGYKQGEKWGIYRTTDGGDTWTNVSDQGASGNATITSNGDIFWYVLWDQQIIKSADHGLTWARLGGPARGNVIEVSPAHLVALGGARKNQLYASADAGKTWRPFGQPLPFQAHGFTYNAVRKSFLVWAEHDNDGRRKPGETLRWDLGADPDAVMKMIFSRPGVVPVNVPFAAKAITVDGSPDDWTQIASMPLPFMKKASSATKLCWRADGLYGLVTAPDEHISVNRDSPWLGDCFELFIEKDAAGLADRSSVTEQYIFAPDPAGKPGPGLVRVAYGNDPAAKLVCQWQKTDSGYTLEFFIPAELLKPAAMAAGTRLGCNFALSVAGRPIEQFYADKNANASYSVPASWGLLELAKP